MDSQLIDRDPVRTLVRAPRILVVDDEIHTRLSLGVVLASAGYSVSEAADGQEALAEIARLETADPVDLVLLDLQMPGMDGFAVLERLAERSADLPVVVMTGYGDRRTRERIAALGRGQILLKPFRPEVATARVAAVLGQPGAEPAPWMAPVARREVGRLPLDGEVPGLAVRAWSCGETCGAWLAVLPLPGGAGLVLVDPSGPGDRTALHAGFAGTAFAHRHELGREPARVLDALDSALFAGGARPGPARALALAAGRGQRCRVALAGAPPVLLQTPDGGCRRVGTPGTPIGGEGGDLRGADAAALPEGSRLVVVNPGLDAALGVDGGRDQLAAAARVLRHLPPAAAAERLLAEGLRRSAGAPADDLMIAVLDPSDLPARGMP